MGMLTAAGSRWALSICELEGEQGECREWWLLVDVETGEYLDGWKFGTAVEALAVARELEGGAS